MSRLKTADKAKTVYQGSGQSRAFNPGNAASNVNRLKEERQSLSEEESARQRELTRQQQAQDLDLQARQAAQTADLNVINTVNKGNLERQVLREQNDLKLVQQQAINDQKISHAIQGYELSDKQTTRKNQQGLTSQFENAKASLNVSTVAAQGQHNQRKIKLIGDIAQLSLTFAGDVVKYGVHLAEQRAEQAEVDDFFSLLEEPEQPDVGKPSAAESSYVSEVTATEDAIQKTTGSDYQLGNSLRSEPQKAIQKNQVRRINATQVANELPGKMRAFLNSNTPLVDHDGNSFTPATAQTQEQVNISIRAGMSRYAREVDLKSMSTDQLRSVVIPAARAVMQQQSAMLGAQVTANRQEAAKQNAIDTSSMDLAAGQDAGLVYQRLTAELYASGQYRGSKGAAAEEAFGQVVAYAKATRNEALLDQLAAENKVPGNSGTNLGKIKAAQLEEARRAIRNGSVEDYNLSKREDGVRIDQIGIARLEALNNPDLTPEMEAQINRDTIAQLEATGSSEGLKEATRLRNLGANYNPYAFSALQEKQVAGEHLSNAELKELVANKDITSKEAKTLGWDPEGTGSADEVAQEALKKYNVNKDIDGMANGLTGEILDKDTTRTYNPEAKRLAISTVGRNMSSDLSRRLKARMFNFVRNNPDANESEVRERLNLEYKNLAETTLNSVKYNAETNQFDGYTYGGSEYPNSSTQTSTPTYTFKNQDGAFGRDYTNYDASELKRWGYDAQPTVDKVITRQELLEAHKTRLEGGTYTQELEDRAAALGTNAETLIRMQGTAHNIPIINEFTPTPVSGSGNATVDGLRVAIIGHESGGDFNAVNKHSGALGYGQVMPANVPDWTRQALGYSMTPRQFLNNPEAQMKVINYKLNRLWEHQLAAGYTGDIAIRRVASIWYSGKGHLYDRATPEYYKGHKYISIGEYTRDILRRVRQNPLGH